MATKKIDFSRSDTNLTISTATNHGIGQYFLVKEDGSNGMEDEFQSGSCMKLSISRIHYKKSLYKPGYVHVEMTINNFGTFSEKQYTDALKIYFLAGQRTLSLVNGSNTYVEGYYITNIGIKQKAVGDSSVTMAILKAYSPDYFLTINKYSKSYRGKTLSQIIETTLDDTFGGDDSILKDRFTHNHLCHTTDNNGEELKQPYLVQYNESFHDFVVRTANRCGELFYYEDGKLILGVDDNNLNVIDGNNTDIKVMGTICDTLPEEMEFASIPAPFIKKVNTLNKSYLVESTDAMDKASKGKLYFNQNIENADALHTTSADESQTAEDLRDGMGLGIASGILGAGGLVDAISGVAGNIYDTMTGSIDVAGSEKVVLTEPDIEINNHYHTQTQDASDNEVQIDAFKENYEAEHPEDFMEEKTVDYDPFSQPGSMANKELELYLQNAKTATRDHLSVWKANYKINHPEAFESPLDKSFNVRPEIIEAKSIYDSERRAYMKASGFTFNSIVKTEKAIEEEECQLIFANVNDNERDTIWHESLANPDDSTKNAPYLALVSRFKEKYKKNNPDQFKTTCMVALADTEPVWNDEASKPAMTLKAYLDNSQGKSNLTNDFYAWIESAERRNTDSIQIHRLKDTAIPEYKLGQYYKLSNTADALVYIINQVEVDIYSETSEGNYKLKANISLSKTEQDTKREEQQAYQFKTFPPLADIPHIRKAEPQIAEVTDVADPQRAGRVQIRYPWMEMEDAPTTIVDGEEETLKDINDEDANPQYSPWIPVLVPFTGTGSSGFLMTPDKGDMVMINYEGGNIERPYVDGSVFCGTGSTNWGAGDLDEDVLDFHRTHHAITYKGNGITFKGGNSKEFVNSMLPSILGGTLSTLGIEEELEKDSSIGGGMTLSDTYGIYSISMSSASRSISIDSPWGNVAINAFTGITLSAPNGDIKIEGKNVTIEAGNKVEIKSGGNIKSDDDSIGKDIADAVGGFIGEKFIKPITTDAFTDLTGINLGKAFDLSFARNVWEIIFRPVDGSLKVGAGRNLMMTAGPGKITVPASTLSNAKVPAAIGLNPIKMALNTLKGSFAGQSQEDANPLLDIGGMMYKYTAKAGRKMNEAYEICQEVRANLEVLKQTAPENLQGLKYDECTYVKLFDKVKGKTAVKEADLLADDNISYEARRWAKQRVEACDKLVELIKTFVENPQKWFKDDIFDIPKPYWLDSVGKFKKLSGSDIEFDDIVKAMFDNLSSVEDRLNYIYSAAGTSGLFDQVTRQLKLQIVLKIAEQSKLFEFKIDDERWGDLELDKFNTPNDVAGMQALLKGNVRLKSAKEEEDDDVSGFMSSILDGAGLGGYISYNDDKGKWELFNTLKKNFNINGQAGPRSIWDTSSGNGAILFSDNEDASYTISGTSDTGMLVKTRRTKDWDEIVDMFNL